MICNLCKAEPCEPWCKYEYPIHQIPVPKSPEYIHHDAVHRVLCLLHEKGDHYGARLIVENAHLLSFHVEHRHDAPQD
jgi:hypothetical protein